MHRQRSRWLSLSWRRRSHRLINGRPAHEGWGRVLQESRKADEKYRKQILCEGKFCVPTWTGSEPLPYVGNCRASCFYLAGESAPELRRLVTFAPRNINDLYGRRLQAEPCCFRSCEHALRHDSDRLHIGFVRSKLKLQQLFLPALTNVEIRVCSNPNDAADED